MQVRYVHHEDYQFCYSFRGRPGHKPSILMLHGFSAHKDMWLSVVKVWFQSHLSQMERVSTCMWHHGQWWNATGTQGLHSSSSVLKPTQCSIQNLLSEEIS